MRLSEQERAGIIEAVAVHVGSMRARLLLYGSRARDDLKGGDIDLLVVVDTPLEADKLSMKEHVLLSDIKKKIGDRKIDLVIKSNDVIQNDPFWQLASRSAVLLKDY